MDLSRFFLQLTFVVMLVVMGWMAVRAFHNADSPVVEERDSQPATASVSNPVASSGGSTPTRPATKAEHTQHQQAGGVVQTPLPKHHALQPNKAIPRDGQGLWLVDWELLAATTLDKHYHPTFPDMLKELDGQFITLHGFMSPLNEVGAMKSFLLLEVPVGCFYCLTPPPTGVIAVELTEGQSVEMSYNPITITGTLRLNANDPEDFLYSITSANVKPAD